MMSSPLPIAVRAYTERLKRRRRVPQHPRPAGRRVPTHILVIDTETTTEVTQALLFLTYRFCKVAETEGRFHCTCLEEGLVYADDLCNRDPGGGRRLCRYAARHHLALRSRQAFLKEILWPAYRGRIWIVGFNLPFDLSRLAAACGETRIRNKYDHRLANGFSFVLWAYLDAEGRLRGNPFRPRIVLRAIDRSRAFKAFQRPGRLDDVSKITGGASYGTQARQAATHVSR